MASHSRDVLSRLPVDVPAALAARADAWTTFPQAVEPARSASVMLLRDGPQGLETYLLHRHSRMPFAASMVVFPGGRVDVADATSGRDPVRVCAVRETGEETGVTLAEEDLYDWAHWTTPAFEPRRFDTRFFVAALPSGQEAQDISGETDRAAWSRPSTALAEADRGEIALMPPTRSILLELSDVASVPEILELASGRIIEPVLPRLLRQNGVWVFQYPVRS